MLGNLVAFLFGNVNVTAGIFARLEEQFHPNNWHGTYKQVLPHLQQAFSLFLVDMSKEVDPAAKAEITLTIKQLCNPDLAKRGHPRAVGKFDQYSLERYVSFFDRLAKAHEINERVSKKAG
jgi:hypothetical protein